MITNPDLGWWLFAACHKRDFCHTAAGAEIDLVLVLPGGKLWAIEIKRSSATQGGTRASYCLQ